MEIFRTTKTGNNIEILSLEPWAEDHEYNYGTARIRTDKHDSLWVHVVGLVFITTEKYGLI